MKPAASFISLARQIKLGAGRALVGMAARCAGAQNAADMALARETLRRLYEPKIGAEYGIGLAQKRALAAKIRNITRRVPSGTAWQYHVILATEILSLPKGMAGDVVECGCWKGASSASLSLACALIGRRLFVCDSFEGLPADKTGEVHDYPHVGVYGYYEPGMYVGQLEEVRGNITRFGAIACCEFVKGFFNESLKALRGPVAFAFLDVDLESSLWDCVRQLWPLMPNDAMIYTDDSCDMKVVRPWFDNERWMRDLGQMSPGYVGSGCGLPVHPSYSSLGYARKVAHPEKSYGRISWLRYGDEQPPAESA